MIWMWGPKSGMMGGSKKEGGISIAPMYQSADVDWSGGDSGSADATNYGLAVVYNVPGGWMQVHGVWDNVGCEGTCLDFSDVVAEEGDDSYNTFTLIAEYKF